MIPLVYLPKQRALPLGVVAIDCPECGLRAVADIYRVEQAQTIYFVEVGGGWRDAGAYVVCRRCRCQQPLPPNLRASLNPGPEVDEPSPALIADCLAPLPPVPPTLPPLRWLPPTVTRAEWALLRALTKARNRALAHALTLVAVVAGGSVLAGGLCLAGADIVFNLNPSAAFIWSLVLLWAIAVAVTARFTWHQLIATLQAEFDLPLRRHFARTHTQPSDLLRAGAQFPLECFALRPFLSWIKAPPPPPPG